MTGFPAGMQAGIRKRCGAGEVKFRIKFTKGQLK